jgi:hypothetical protein
MMMRWSLWRRKQREADLEDEIRYDLALEAEQRIQSGLPREEAERRSERDFGNVLLVKEGVRDMWGWTSLERLVQDLRYGWRTLRKSPSFTAMATLSLALGIGANTAIYSFMDAILMGHCRRRIRRSWSSSTGTPKTVLPWRTELAGLGIAILAPAGREAAFPFPLSSVSVQTAPYCPAPSPLLAPGSI